MRLVLIAICAAALVGCGAGGCPEGTRSEFSHYITVFNGKTTTLIPQFTCEPKR